MLIAINNTINLLIGVLIGDINVMENKIKDTSFINHESQNLQTDARHSRITDEQEVIDNDENRGIDEMLNNQASDKNTVHQHNETLEHEHDADIGGLHPIELAAHSILNAPLDHLNEDFELLSQSQYILLTRLKLIEDRLKSFQKVVIDDGNMTSEKDISEAFNKIRDLKKRLVLTVKSLDKVEARVERMSKKLKIDGNE